MTKISEVDFMNDVIAENKRKSKVDASTSFEFVLKIISRRLLLASNFRQLESSVATIELSIVPTSLMPQLFCVWF